MRILLHIGSEKTGTTTVQRWCARNRKALKARGILYPTTLGQVNHVRLACFAAEQKQMNDLRKSERIFVPEVFERFRAELPDALAREVRESGCHTLLISNEHLSSRLSVPAELQTVRGLLEQACGQVTAWQIIHYVRRQDEMIHSMYSTTVKSGGSKPFRLPHGLRDPRLNPLIVLDLWAGQFGAENITVRVFDRRELRGGDVVQDLMALAGVEDAADTSIFAAVPEKNPRLGGQALEFLRRFNEHVPAFDAEGINAERRGVVRALEALPDRDPVQLAEPAAMEAFLARFDQINAEVARRYLGRADGRLFAPASSRPEEARPMALDADAAIRIAAHLWRWRAGSGAA